MPKRYSWEVWLSLGFVSLGLVMIGVAWNGAASVDTPEQQIPYILSGGLGGIALVGLGVGMLLFISGRRMATKLETKYDQIIEAIQGTAGLRAADEHAQGNGKRPEQPVAADGMVVVGRSSFHMPDCRLVVGKGEMDVVAVDEARARGLEPCRVCEPHHVTEAVPVTEARRRTRRR